MAESDPVKLHGFWASPVVYRVIWALNLKGVKYEYIEEDLSNKSSALLEYNPVHKKVPVLVHGGKPVVESMVILEYIDETWPDRKPLLPGDPYERAMARFWIDFGRQSSLSYVSFLQSSEEDKEKTAAKAVETLKIVQDEALADKKFFGGNTLSLVDLFYGLLVHWFEIMEELVGVSVLTPNTLPKLHQWKIDFKQENVIKENLPEREELLAYLKKIREMRPSSSKNNNS